MNVDLNKIADALENYRLLIVKEQSGVSIPEDSTRAVVGALRAAMKTPAPEGGYISEEPLTYMLRAPGCVTGPCESLFSVAVAKALEMPKGTAIVPLYERSAPQLQRSQEEK